jgi:hypothetical protein
LENLLLVAAAAEGLALALLAAIVEMEQEPLALDIQEVTQLTNPAGKGY